MGGGDAPDALTGWRCLIKFRAGIRKAAKTAYNLRVRRQKVEVEDERRGGPVARTLLELCLFGVQDRLPDDEHTVLAAAEGVRSRRLGFHSRVPAPPHLAQRASGGTPARDAAPRRCPRPATAEFPTRTQDLARAKSSCSKALAMRSIRLGVRPWATATSRHAPTPAATSLTIVPASALPSRK